MYNPNSSSSSSSSNSASSNASQSLPINLLLEPYLVPNCYVDSNNTLCPVIPVSGALAVSKNGQMVFAFNRDNTCKTTEALKEYLRKSVSSLREYKQKLESDIRTMISIDYHREQLNKMQDRLRQVDVLIPLVQAVVSHPMTTRTPSGSLSATENLGYLPNIFNELLNASNSNLYGVLFNPGNQDGYLNTQNRKYTVSRSANSYFQSFLMTTFGSFLSRITMPNFSGQTKADFIVAMLSGWSEQDRRARKTYADAINLVLAQGNELYRQKCSGRVNIFTLTSSQKEALLTNLGYIYGNDLEHDQLEPDDVNDFVGTVVTLVCQGEAPQALPDEEADKLFSKSSNHSPFLTYRAQRVGNPIAHYSTEEKLSTIVQNFFAFYGVFALHLGLTTENFGVILDREAQDDLRGDSVVIPALRRQLNTVMCRHEFSDVGKTLVEDALCDFIETYKLTFRLSRVLKAEEINNLKWMFSECWRMNYHAPHWDELFFFFPKDQNSAQSEQLVYFLQNNFCISLEVFAEKLMTMNAATHAEHNAALSTALRNYRALRTSRKVNRVTPPSTVLETRYQPFSASVTLKRDHIKAVVRQAINDNNEDMLSILVKTITREGGYIFEQLDKTFFEDLNADFYRNALLLWQALIPKLPFQGQELQRFKAKVMPTAGQEYFVLDRFAELKLRAAVQSCCELTVENIYRPFSAESTKFYLNKLHELANSTDEATKQHCAAYAGVNLVNVSTSSEDAGKCILRGSPAEIAKIKQILTRNDKLVYLSSRQAATLYKAVGEIYGLTSNAFKEMMPLNNNTPGDPRSYRLERAFELLHLLEEVESISYNNTINSREYMNAGNRENGQPKKGGSGFCVTVSRRVDPHTFIRKIEEYETVYANQFVLDAEAKTALFTSVGQQAPGLLALYLTDEDKVKAAFLFFGIEHQGIYDRRYTVGQSVLTYCDMRNQAILKHLLIRGQSHLPEAQQNNKKRFPINNEDKQYLGADYQPHPVSALNEVNLSNAVQVKSMLDRLQAQQDSVVAVEAVPVNASQNMVIDTLTKRDAFSLYTALLDRQGLPPNRISKFATPATLSLCLSDLARYYPDIDVENTTIVQNQDGSLGVRTTVETQAKLNEIAAEYRNTVYISMIMAPALYKEVEKRYGRTSFAYQFMQALSNNAGDSIPHKFIIALTLLGINLPLNGIRYNNTRDKRPGSTDFGGGGFVVANVSDDLLKQIEAITEENHDLTILSSTMYSNLEMLFLNDNVLSVSSADAAVRTQFQEIRTFIERRLEGLTTVAQGDQARKLGEMLSLLGIAFSGQVEEQEQEQANGELSFRVHMLTKEVSKLKHVLRSVPGKLCHLPLYQENILSVFDFAEFQRLEGALSATQKGLLKYAKSDNFKTIRFTQKQAKDLKAALGAYPLLAQKIRTLFIDEKEVLWNNDDTINVEGYTLQLHASGSVAQPVRSPAFAEGCVIASNSSSRETQQEGSELLFKQACRVAGFLAQHSVDSQVCGQTHQAHEALLNSVTTQNVTFANSAYPLAIIGGPSGQKGGIYIFPNLITGDYGNFDAWFTRIGDKPNATPSVSFALPLSPSSSAARLETPSSHDNSTYSRSFFSTNRGASSASASASAPAPESIFNEETRFRKGLIDSIDDFIAQLKDKNILNVRQTLKISALVKIKQYIEGADTSVKLSDRGIPLQRVLQLMSDICQIKARPIFGMFNKPALLSIFEEWKHRNFLAIDIDTVTSVDETIILDHDFDVSKYLTTRAPRNGR